MKNADAVRCPLGVFRPLTKAESPAMLQEPLYAQSDLSSVSDDTHRENPTINTASQASVPVAVYVSLRRGRIALLTVAMAGIIAGLVLFFEKGYEIRQYDKTALNATTQKDILDRYNSYSGSITSAFGKPIELFVGACVQVILLRFVTSSLLRNEPSWKAVYGALALSAAIVYLITNGFSSLNVQLVDLEVRPMISSSDLSRNDSVIAGASDWQSRSTNISQSFSDAQLENPIANTVLRSLVLPRAARAKFNCVSTKYTNMVSRFPLDTVQFAFSSTS